MRLHSRHFITVGTVTPKALDSRCILAANCQQPASVLTNDTGSTPKCTCRYLNANMSLSNAQTTGKHALQFTHSVCYALIQVQTTSSKYLSWTAKTLLHISNTLHICFSVYYNKLNSRIKLQFRYKTLYSYNDKLEHLLLKHKTIKFHTAVRRGFSLAHSMPIVETRIKARQGNVIDRCRLRPLCLHLQNRLLLH